MQLRNTTVPGRGDLRPHTESKWAQQLVSRLGFSPAPGSRAGFGPGTAAACAEQPPPSINTNHRSGPSMAGNREAGGSRDPLAMITCVSWGESPAGTSHLVP